MSKIKIVKRLYSTLGSFEILDEYGNQCWITFEQAGYESMNPDADSIQMQNVFQPIPIEQG